MRTAGFARLPAPPYCAVIFASRRSGDDDANYEATAPRRLELARAQPGFPGVESARGDGGFGPTVSYGRDEAAITARRDQAGHRLARAQGRMHGYDHFELRVARVERASGRYETT